jgi:5-methylcytosine-specific restriction endonuclease McrA
MPWSPKRLSDLRGRGQKDADYRRRRMADPALAEAERIRNTGRWRWLRKVKLARDPLCEDCRERGRIEPARQVHHMEPLVRRPDLAYTLENLRSLCTTCHARREAEARRTEAL